MHHSHFAGDVIEGCAERFHGVKKFKIQWGEINSAKKLIRNGRLVGLGFQGSCNPIAWGIFSRLEETSYLVCIKFTRGLEHVWVVVSVD